MRAFIRRFGKTIVILVTAFVSFLLLISAISMLGNYSEEIEDRSVSKSQYYTVSRKQAVVDKFSQFTAKAIAAATDASEAQTEVEFYSYLLSLQSKPAFADPEFRFTKILKDGQVYSDMGELYTDRMPALKFYEEYPGESGYIGIFEDSTLIDGAMSMVGFLAPTPNCEYADAIILCYTRPLIESFFNPKEETEAEFSVFAVSTGEIVSGRNEVEHTQILNYLRDLVGEKDAIDSIRSLAANGTDGTVIVNIRGSKYVVSVGADRQRMRDLAVIEMYSVDKLCASGFGFIHTVTFILILFAVIASGVVVFLVVNRIRREREIKNLETMDKSLECYNRNGFEKEAARIIERNRGSYFAIVTLQIRHFKHLEESYGEAETSHLVSFIRYTCAKTAGLEETYGYDHDGDFLLLLHAKDRPALLERLKIHSFLATQYKGANKFDVLLKYGIFEVRSQDSISVSQMINYANEANSSVLRATEENAGMVFNLYNDEIRQIRLENESMELRMEGALKDGEFQVFYQPKYSLKNGKQDGCEALVRWFDPKTGQYNRPALFMQLFETNGFIVKLDKYVYLKVCEYISYSVSQGRTVYPVSVNVSRITAVQPDFVDYYTKIKRRHGIADGQIMIEFTESFAYENYETLFSIVDGLHKGGFKCSIDDFGCGYSSYRILKTLPMDEIKLDKFFLEKGDARERDITIFKSIIGLAKDLGMKVTQEGVELREDVDLLLELGCDVLQGYFYSHPLSLSDYLSFTQSSAEHNITDGPNKRAKA